MPRFSIKARLITLFQKSQRIDIWNNEILLRKSVVYTDGHFWKGRFLVNWFDWQDFFENRL